MEGGGPPGTPRATRPGEGEPEVPDAKLWDTPAGCATLGRWPSTGWSGERKGREGTGRRCKASEPQREEERVAVHRRADLRILKNGKGFRRTVWMTDLGSP